MAAERSRVTADQVVAAKDYSTVAMGVSDVGDYRTGVPPGTAVYYTAMYFSNRAQTLDKAS